MKKLIITALTIFLIITSGLNFVSAEFTTEENMTNTSNGNESLRISESESEKNRTGEEVRATQRGNYNITFDDGYNGYCINLGDAAAEYNDLFTVQDTSLAVNHKTGESVGNYIKTFFVEFYDIAVKDRYKTQEIIWAFTDDFRFYDQDLLNEIKEKSVEKIIPDHGAVKRINNTTEAIFDFEVLDSQKQSSQNFFGYRIRYTTINDGGLGAVEPENNTTVPENNITTPETNTTKEENKTIPENNITTPENNMTNITVPSDENSDTPIQLKSDEKYVSQNLIKHATGNEILIIVLVLILAGLIIIRYKRN